MLQLDHLSKQHLAVPVLWKLHSVSLNLSACYPAISWCIRRPVGVPVPRMHAHYATSLDTT